MLIRPILLKKLIDKALKVKSWISWEPETLETELNSSGIKELSQYKKHAVFTNLIDAIRAVLSKDSMALMEWHIFENVLTAFAGKIPDFFETTPPATHDAYFAIRFLEDFLPDLEEELSEETMMYIGSLFITEGVLVHLHKGINNAIDLTAKLTSLDIAKDKAEQAEILKELGGNEKLLKALAASVTSGGEDLGVSDKAPPDKRRALQILTSYLFFEHALTVENIALGDFLKDCLNDVAPAIIEKIDSARAAMPDKDVSKLDGAETDDYVNSLINTSAASTGGTAEDTEVLLKSVKAADAIPGLAGFNYHAGQLYNVTNEIGKDDIPKSKLLNDNTHGDVLSSGDSGGSFSRPSKELTIMGKNGPVKEDETHKDTASTSAADSSLELAGI